LLAFPGAEGFGADATGGRGGSVCRVTTLAGSGPGSLQACVDLPGARTVVFAVSGVIQDDVVEIVHGDLTLAGQTSPGGVVIEGAVLCDNYYDPNTCNNVVLRHLRVRRPSGDALRITGAHDVIVDHCSFANATDESIEISRSERVTVQRSILAEPLGDHYTWGGLLLNYSSADQPLDAITLHHNLWDGVYGRLPEISCEGTAPESNCEGHVIQIEVTNNLLFDASDPIWYNRCTGTNDGNYCDVGNDNVSVALNFVGNQMLRRSTMDEQPLIVADIDDAPLSEVFYADDQLGYGDGPPRGAGSGHPQSGCAARLPRGDGDAWHRARGRARCGCRRLSSRSDGHPTRELPRSVGRRPPARVGGWRRDRSGRRPLSRLYGAARRPSGFGHRRHAR
jgi:hypothetical protein